MAQTRLLSQSPTLQQDLDGVSADIQTAIVSQTAAVVATRSVLTAVTTPTAGQAVTLLEGLRTGMFVWKAGDYSAYVTADDQQGIYIPSALNTSGTFGCWVRQFMGPMDVLWFGAVGDCADVSTIVATSQTTIATAVASATDDFKAFRAATKLCQLPPFPGSPIAGGGEIVFGRSGRIHRITLNATQLAITIPAHTTLRGIDGGRIEADCSQIVDWHTVVPTNPAGYIACYGAIFHIGNPITGTHASPSSATIDGADLYAGSAMAKSRCTPGCKFIDVDIRCHQRRHDRDASSAQDLRFEGIACYYGYDLNLIRCRTMGFAWNGISTSGGWNITVEDCISELNGFGAQVSSSCNGITMIGTQFVGNRECSSRNLRLINPTTRNNKDTGIAYSYCDGIIVTGAIGTGDHDRHIEGIYASASSATAGEIIRNRQMVTDCDFDGQHNISTLSAGASAGATVVSLVDAFYCDAGETSLDRFLFITGSGAAGGDGPYAIQSVDHVANTVTLKTGIGANVLAGAVVYTQARSVFTGTDTGNETKSMVANYRASNVYCLVHAFSATMTSKGIVSFTNIDVDNIQVPSNFALIGGAVTNMTITGLRARNCGGNQAGSYIIVNSGPNVSSLVIDNIDVDSGFDIGVLYANTTGSGAVGEKVIIRNSHIRGTLNHVLVVQFGAVGNIGAVGLVAIENCRLTNINQAAIVNNGLVCHRSLYQTIGEIRLVDNTCISTSPMQRPIVLVTTASSYTANSVGVVTCKNNDWNGGQAFGMYGSYAAGSSNYDPYISSAVDNSTNIFTIVNDSDNNFLGQRTIRRPTAAAPTGVAGTYGKGDWIRYSDTAAGASPGAVCTTPGTVGGLPSATTTAAISNNRQVQLNDVTGLVPGSWINITGASPTLHRVTTVDPVGKIIGVSESLGTGLAVGAAVSNVAPVLKALPIIAA